MRKYEPDILRIELKLDTFGADLETLKKYGKVEKGITREILVPADMTLHALHFVIQQAFGWGNGHLHRFTLPDAVFRKLTDNRFAKWADYCGIYFRFPSDDFEDLYWDDDYDGMVTSKTWYRRKYTGPYKYEGTLEHFMDCRADLRSFLRKNKKLRVELSFAEWLRLSESEREKRRARPEFKSPDEMTVDQMQTYFADLGGLEELLERLKLTEVLGRKATDKQLKAMVADADKRYDDYNPNKRDKIIRYYRNFDSLDGVALPLTDRLLYEYDYGDGWEVNIKLVDEYYKVFPGFGSSGEESESGSASDADSAGEIWASGKGEIIEGELKEQFAAVIAKHRPVCIALDGLPVLDDVGGIFGYINMLEKIHSRSKEPEAVKECAETIDWARSQGWNGKLVKPEKLL